MSGNFSVWCGLLESFWNLYLKLKFHVLYWHFHSRQTTVEMFVCYDRNGNTCLIGQLIICLVNGTFSISQYWLLMFRDGGFIHHSPGTLLDGLLRKFTQYDEETEGYWIIQHRTKLDHFNNSSSSCYQKY